MGFGRESFKALGGLEIYFGALRFFFLGFFLQTWRFKAGDTITDSTRVWRLATRVFEGRGLPCLGLAVSGKLLVGLSTLWLIRLERLEMVDRIGFRASLASC